MEENPTHSVVMMWMVCVPGGGLTDVDGGGLQLMQIQTVNIDSAAAATSHPVARQLPPDCPLWVAYLNDYEVFKYVYNLVS